MCILPMYICRVFLLQKGKTEELIFLLRAKGYSLVKIVQLRFWSCNSGQILFPRYVRPSVPPKPTVPQKPWQDKQETKGLILLIFNWHFAHLPPSPKKRFVEFFKHKATDIYSEQLANNFGFALHSRDESLKKQLAICIYLQFFKLLRLLVICSAFYLGSPN